MFYQLCSWPYYTRNPAEWPSIKRGSDLGRAVCKFMCWPHGGGMSHILLADSKMNNFFLLLLPPSPPPHQGEICLCTSRIYVERSIYPEFLKRFVAATREWKTGSPSDPDNDNGALVSREHLEKVWRHIISVVYTSVSPRSFLLVGCLVTSPVRWSTKPLCQ